MNGGLSLEWLSGIYWVGTKKEVRYFSNSGDTLGDTRRYNFRKISLSLPSSKSFWQRCKSGWRRKISKETKHLWPIRLFLHIYVLWYRLWQWRESCSSGAFLPSWPWEYIIRRAEEQHRSCPSNISVSAMRKAQPFHLFRWSSKTRAFFREKWEDVGKSICVHT